MSGGFRVEPAELDARAVRMSALADRLRTAAGSGLALDPHAYGVLGQVFALAATAAVEAGRGGVAGLAGRAGTHARQLRAAAADYRRVERAVAAGLGGAR